MKLKLFFIALITSALALAQTAPSYYNSIDFTKTNNELKSQLATLITNTHTTKISYDRLKDEYRYSDADPAVPGNILLVYGYTQTGGIDQRSRAYGPVDWNREHVYPKSLGNPNLGTSGPGSDGHHLRPSDIQKNSNRGNLPFSDGSGISAYSTNGGWYPGDEWKGDVARIMMYMYIRYNTQCSPNRVATGSNTYSPDFPDIFLKWNIEDPVSDFEKQHNEHFYTVQGNRNPFIDNPYLASVIWNGDAAENTWPDTFSGGGTPDTEAPTTPTNLAAGTITTASIALTWTASTDNVAVTSYDIFVNGVFKANSTTTSTTITGLTPETAYSIYVIAKDAKANKSGASNTISATTLAGAPVQTSCGTEDFENIPTAASNYDVRTWTNNNITWDATNARTDQTLNGRAITIKGPATLKSSTISGGIGSLTVKTNLPFSDSAGNLTVKINGVNKGTIPFAKATTTFTLSDINIEGNFSIEISNSSARVTIDDLSWTCYSTLGTSEVGVSKTLMVYPNPVKNQEVTVDGLEKNDTIKIYSMNGQLVQTVEKVNNKEKVHLKKLSKGIYILKSQKKSTKIIVE